MSIKSAVFRLLKTVKLVGIITETDLLRTLVELTGAHQPGSQIEIKVPNRAGSSMKLATVIKNRKQIFQVFLVYPEKQDEKYKILVFGCKQ